jgi:lipopolysaccharide exporter
VEIIWALGLGVLVSTFESMGLLDFRRNLEFRAEFILTIVPRLAGNICVIAIAAIWHSYWALIVGTLVMRSARTILSYFLHPYRPAYSLECWRRIAGFSFWTWAMGVAVLVRDRCDIIIVGRMLATVDVGFFSMASEIATLPTSELVEPLTHVLFPSFSAVRNAGGDVGEPYMRAIALAFLLTVPAGLGVSLIATPLVLLLLGPNWEQAIPLIQIIAFAGILKVITAISTTAFRADGIPKTTFAVTCAAAALRIGLVVTLTIELGLFGAAIGVVVAVMLEELAFLVVGFRRYHVTLYELLRDVWRIVLASLVMSAVLYATGLGWGVAAPGLWSLILHILTASLLGAIIYSVMLYGSWRLSGRPAGAESYLLGLIEPQLSRLATKLGLVR